MTSPGWSTRTPPTAPGTGARRPMAGSRTPSTRWRHEKNNAHCDFLQERIIKKRTIFCRAASGTACRRRWPAPATASTPPWCRAASTSPGPRGEGRGSDPATSLPPKRVSKINRDASFSCSRSLYTLFLFFPERRPGLRLLHRDPEPVRQPAEELLVQRSVQVSAKCIVFCPDSSLVLSKQCPSFRESQYATAVTVSTWPSNQYWVISNAQPPQCLGEDLTEPQFRFFFP